MQKNKGKTMSLATHTYKKVGDLEIEIDVYTPEDGSKETPVLVLLHGGCLMQGDRSGYNPESDRHKHFFQMGATIISVDYRLAPETKLPGIIEDIQDCFRWIHTEGYELYGYDRNRIIVAGHSAGGYLTMMCGFCLDKAPQGLIPYYGYGDVTQAWYSQPDPYYCSKDKVGREETGFFANNPETTTNYDGRNLGSLYLYYRQNGLWTKEVGGVDPEKNPGFFNQYEPIKNLSRNYPSSLFLHGDNDTDVPYSKSVDMSKALTAIGVQNELITINDGSHGFDQNIRDEQVIAATEKVKQFINKIFYGRG
jgi:acetyl esterase/lipase